MESMINLDGATLLFPTSFGYFDPHIAQDGGEVSEGALPSTAAACGPTRHPKNVGSYFGYIDEAPVRRRHRRRPRPARPTSSASSPPSRSRRCCATSTPSLLGARSATRMRPPGDLHRRLVDAGQGGRSHQQPGRRRRRRHHLPRRRPEDRDGDRRAARHLWSAATTPTRRRSRRRATSPAPSGTGRRSITRFVADADQGRDQPELLSAAASRKASSRSRPTAPTVSEAARKQADDGQGEAHGRRLSRSSRVRSRTTRARP